jgi:hypothetical protein
VKKYIPGYEPPQVTVESKSAAKIYRVTPFAVTYFILATIITVEIYFMYVDEPFSFFLLNVAAIVIVAPILIGIFDKFNLSHLGRDVFYYGILFFIGAFFIGIEAGRNDRHKTYSHYRTGLGRCEKFAVIRRIDSYYLAILPSSRKALINDDCKIKIRFPLTKIDR